MSGMNSDGDNASPKLAWRTPVLNEDEISDVTCNYSNRPGDDGLDQFPGYESSGLS